MPEIPDTIVLIHGFWVTPRSWEHWIDRYERRGYRVLAPAYPGFEVEVDALNADPSPIEAVTIPAIVEHLEALIRELESSPILIGHSAGGAFVQILLDHGYGAAGVAFNSAPTEGVPVVPRAGTEDHLMPPKIQWSNAKHYTSDTVTEVVEFSGKAHLLPAQDGWEEIADYALAWAVRHARTPAAQQASTMA